MASGAVELPEPFRGALERHDPRAVSDVACDSPPAFYARGLARAALGRDQDARADYEAAKATLGDDCLLELAFLDQKQNRELEAALATAKEIRSRAAAASPRFARASHVVGLVHMKQGRHAAALDALLEASKVYGGLPDLAGRAQVSDSLGMVQADAGQLEDAVHYLALSLVDKTLLNDRLGIALTLGNLGRLHLGAGRTREAIACFERDLAISTSLDDQRGIARMNEDLGRAYLALQDHPQAERFLREARRLAVELGYPDLQFFACKDLALTFCRQQRWSESLAELAAAESIVPALSGDYFRTLLSAAHGEVLAARGDPAAVELLQTAVAGFAEQQFPEGEIAARLALAQALAAGHAAADAQSCLLSALVLAQRRGLRRYVGVLGEMLAGLGLVEGAAMERDRQVVQGEAGIGDNYLLIEPLGQGTYGEVFRVYDARRGEQVAFKRLLLEGIYDPRLRDALLRSARIELDVASRVRHPAIARVLAVGAEPRGNSYVVQELVRGKSLQQLIAEGRPTNLLPVLQCLSHIAYGLQALHEARVCHRDLKPANVLLRDDGSPVLIDFGIAHAMAEPSGGEFAGTLAYCSPEQLAGKALDGRADLYAFGVLAFEWLCGLRPLEPRGATLDEMAGDIARRAPPSLLEFRPDLDPALNALVQSLLAKKARHRPATAAAVAERLAALAAAPS